METLASEVLSLISSFEVRRAWGNAALLWGCSCPDKHVASRSLQLFRILNPALDQDILFQLINALSATVSDPNKSNQNYAIDILLSLKQIVESRKSIDILETYPQLFWVSISLCSSIHEWEYYEGLQMLLIIIRRIGIDRQSDINMLMSTLPSKWPGGFAGIFSFVSRGLCSSKTESIALQIINSLFNVAVPVFLDTRPSKFLLIVLANLPSILHEKTNSPECQVMSNLCANLSQTCLKNNCDSLSNLLASWSADKITKNDDFLKQLVKIVKEEYLSSEEHVIRICTSMLKNSMESYPIIMLSFLEFLLNDTITRPLLPFDLKGAWIRPLIGLMNTSYSLRATYLLDILFSGRLKSQESEIIVNVGGAQNILAYLRKAKADTPNFLSTGWLIEGNHGDGSVLSRKRLSTVANSCNLSPKLNIVTNCVDLKTRKLLMAEFGHLERIYSGNAS